MNALYHRYLHDEAFRNGVLAGAGRERSRAIARFFSRSVQHLFGHQEPRHAARTRLARQG
ncbi:MAG: hypothetical protein JO035_14180 [Betaproteobacteria bacterium]|nr:hypothetical protein [Betaproteobacteria bacterium]